MAWADQNLAAISPLLIPKAKLSLVPIVLASTKVLTFDSSGVSNDGVLITGSPALQDYMAIEWTASGDVQTYLDADSTKLTIAAATAIDGVDTELTAYNIVNNTAGNVTIYIRGM